MDKLILFLIENFGATVEHLGEKCFILDIPQDEVLRFARIELNKNTLSDERKREFEELIDLSEKEFSGDCCG